MNKWHPKYVMAGWRVIFAARKFLKKGGYFMSKEHGELDRALKFAKNLAKEIN